MNSLKPIKFKKAKGPTAAEDHFKGKYEETKWLLDTMGNDPNAPHDRSRQKFSKKNS